MRSNYTRHASQAVVITAFCCAAAGGISLPAHAQDKPPVVELVPAATCSDASALAPVDAPLVADGALPDTRTEVDFYLISANPGEVLQVEARGEASLEGTLTDPVIGHFDTACELIAQDDDGGEGLNAALIVEVDDRGTFIVAVTAHDDFEFDGGGFFSGSYRLSVATPPAPPAALSSITVQILDRYSRQPLRGDGIPFAFATLYSCIDGGCNDPIADAYTDADGQVRFERDLFDEPLPADSYQLVAEAEGYQSVRSGLFSVGADEDYDIGVMVLTPPSVSFSLTDACDALPTAGARCAFTVRIDNNDVAPLSGAVWSIVTASNTGSPVGNSIYEADADGGGERRQSFTLGARESGSFGFSFAVPDVTAEGAQFCVELLAGTDPVPTVNTIQASALFCIENDAGLFKRLGDAEVDKQFKRLP